MLKGSNKDTNTGLMTFFCCRYYQFSTYSTPFLTAFSVDFEQINVCLKLLISNFYPNL